MIRVRSPLDRKRRKKAISLSIFWDFFAVMLIGIMVMKKEVECASYARDMAVKNWHLICKARPRPCGVVYHDNGWHGRHYATHQYRQHVNIYTVNDVTVMRKVSQKIE